MTAGVNLPAKTMHNLPCPNSRLQLPYAERHVGELLTQVLESEKIGMRRQRSYMRPCCARNHHTGQDSDDLITKNNEQAAQDYESWLQWKRQCCGKGREPASVLATQTGSLRHSRPSTMDRSLTDAAIFLSLCTSYLSTSSSGLRSAHCIAVQVDIQVLTRVFSRVTRHPSCAESRTAETNGWRSTSYGLIARGKEENDRFTPKLEGTRLNAGFCGFNMVIHRDWLGASS